VLLGRCVLAYDPSIKRLVQTTQGWIELHFARQPGGGWLARIGLRGGFGVVVTRFDVDGWAETRSEVGWLSEAPKDGKPFDLFLAELVGIPEAEARQIADQSVQEWRRRSATR